MLYGFSTESIAKYPIKQELLSKVSYIVFKIILLYRMLDHILGYIIVIYG
jgi:hypothetical protein